MRSGILSVVGIRIPNKIISRRGIGLFLGIEFVKCRESREPDENTAVFVKKEMYRNRIIVSTEGRHNNIVKIKPPMSFDQNNVAHFINHFDRAISQVKVQ